MTLKIHAAPTLFMRVALFVRVWCSTSIRLICPLFSQLARGSGMASVSSRRLRKELSEINAEGCPCGTYFCLSVAHLFTPQHAGIKLLSADDFETWFFSIEVLGESLYQASPFRTPCSLLNSVPLGGGLQINVSLRRELPHLLPGGPVRHRPELPGPPTPSTLTVFEP